MTRFITLVLAGSIASCTLYEGSFECEPACDAPLVCLSNTVGGVRCQAPHCETASECPEGLPRCARFESTVAEGVCQEPAGPFQHCEANGDCMSDRCRDAICISVRGGPCAQNGFRNGGCDDGLNCNENGNVCQPPDVPGGQCSTAADCGGGLICDNFERCGGRAGSACKDARQCVPGLACNLALVRDIFGTCAEPGSTGNPCAADSDCTPDLHCETRRCG